MKRDGSALRSGLPACRAFLQVIALIGLAPPTAVAQELGNVCVEDYLPDALCTASDNRVLGLEVVELIEDCASGVAGEAEIVLEAYVSADSSPDRYDHGLFLALDGGSARDGDACYHDFLAPPLETMPVYTDFEPEGGNGVSEIIEGPWWNGEAADPNDACGDIEGGTELFRTLQAVRISCVDSSDDGLVDVSVCLSWDNNTGSTCTSLFEAFPGSPSKCGCQRVELQVLPEPGFRAALLAGLIGLSILHLRRLSPPR